MQIEELREKLSQEAVTRPSFEEWCVLELFGHQRIAGLVTEATIGGCSFIRVDVPKPGEEGDLYTRYFGNGAIYAINPTTKEEVLKIVSALHPKPPTPRVSEQKALPAPEVESSREMGDYDDEDDDDGDYRGRFNDGEY